MMDVLIVGGGVIGCAIAYYLAKGGADVALLEGGEIGGAASGAAAGIVGGLPAQAVPPIPFRDLCAASLALYPSQVESLQAETGIDIQYVTCDALVVAETEAAAEGLRRLAGWRGDPSTGLRTGPLVQMEWVEGQHLRRLEPALSPAVLGAVYYRRHSHVNPGLLTQAFARAAAGRGAVLHQGTAVSSFLRRGDRVLGVRTGDGTIAADHIVLAAGPWTRRLARKLGVDVPTRPMRGQMLAYRATPVRHIISDGEGYLVPKPGGFLYAGATVDDVGFRPHTTLRGLAWLRGMARAVVPALRYAEVVSAWAALRPGSPDGLPILGPLPGWRNVSVATGHFRRGILLAPITGKLIAQLITEGKTEMPLAPFSPGRFG